MRRTTGISIAAVAATASVLGGYSTFARGVAPHPVIAEILWYRPAYAGGRAEAERDRANGSILERYSLMRSQHPDDAAPRAREWVEATGRFAGYKSILAEDPLGRRYLSFHIQGNPNTDALRTLLREMLETPVSPGWGVDPARDVVQRSAFSRHPSALQALNDLAGEAIFRPVSGLTGDTETDRQRAAVEILLRRYRRM